MRIDLTQWSVCFCSETPPPSTTERNRRRAQLRRALPGRRGRSDHPYRAIALPTTPRVSGDRAARFWSTNRGPLDLDPMDLDRLDPARPFLIRSDGSRSRSAPKRYRPIGSRHVALLISFSQEIL